MIGREHCVVPSCYEKPTRPKGLCTKHNWYQLIGMAVMIAGVVVAFFLAGAVLWETFTK